MRRCWLGDFPVPSARQQARAPAVDAFFEWCGAQRRRAGLLPSNPFAQALAYAAEREAGLRVFLEDPEVPVETNHPYADIGITTWGAACAPFR